MSYDENLTEESRRYNLEKKTNEFRDNIPSIISPRSLTSVPLGLKNISQSGRNIINNIAALRAVEHTLTKNKSPAGEISLVSANVMVTHATDSTLELYWVDDSIIQGQYCLIKPIAGKTLVLNPGGNIQLGTPLSISDGTFVLLCRYDDSGSVKFLPIAGGGSGSGDNLGNHQMTQNLEANGFFIEEASGMTLNAAGTLGFLNPGDDQTFEFEAPNAGAFDFYVDRSSTVIPRLGILEDSVQSNVDFFMNNHEIRELTSLRFDKSLSTPTTVNQNNIVGDDEGFTFNIPDESGKKFQFEQQGTPVFTVDPRGSLATFENMNVLIDDAKTFTVRGTSSARQIQIFDFFSEIIANFTTKLSFQKNLTEVFEIDTDALRFPISAGKSIDFSNIRLSGIIGGFAQALPTPVGYIDIWVEGTPAVIPYFLR